MTFFSQNTKTYKETILFTIDPHYGNFISLNNCEPEKCEGFLRNAGARADNAGSFRGGT